LFKRVFQRSPLAINRLNAAGIGWADIDKHAQQIVIFGSFAVSAPRLESDLDILCIGRGQRYKSPDLHLIWIPKEKTRSPQLLTSELGTHVAAYGKWIKGENTWAFQKRPSSRTVARKRRNILLRLNALHRHWNLLLPTFQKNQLLKLRRDIQRYEMMSQGLPPIPKTLLDKEWKARHQTSRLSHLKKFDSLIFKNVLTFLSKQNIQSI
jgi:hypothetical protein